MMTMFDPSTRRLTRRLSGESRSSANMQGKLLIHVWPVAQEAGNQSYGTMTKMTVWGKEKSPLVTFAE